ncbi:hypothetical protein [Streptomyces sp. CMB-StM0423]|uniref:hypothetical protein n=1 Tax=Streptomyces sp. CMB-StM0423 TaxID=2059884 RepID=UPI000C70CE70|nr:hypothetical protein [Streptomyces sp. CMB-StM0423]AUH40402.1 hypothetical protein CXR04_09185 [Streptomyces sp. CMB-StM0423]
MRPDDHARAVRRGPRHAAPRRSLLGRVPAGRAIALAAMPTAVFLGLGLTPRPAIAEDDPAERWRPGPCAEQSEEPKDEEPADAGDAPEAGNREEAPGAGESAKPGGGPSPSPSATDDGPAAERPGGGGDGSGSGSGGASGGGPDGGGAGESGKAEPSPSPSESRPWYDPLGLGDTLDGLLGPDDSAAETGPGDEPSGGSDGADAGAGSAGSGPGSDGGKESGSGAASDEERREKEKAVRDAADEAGATVEELDDKVRDTAEDPADEKPDAGDDAADADGKEPFPCPTPDPGALANAALEPGLPLLPDDPWRLESTKLTLKGLKYHGIVEVKTYSGKVKKVLKYTADDGVDIRDMHQTVVGPGRNTSHVRAAEGSTSTIRDGRVTMYTEELKGSLFGLIPMTFSPESPPPLDLPFAFFTDVQVVQAGQFGGTLTVPGLKNTIE